MLFRRGFKPITNVWRDDAGSGAQRPAGVELPSELAGPRAAPWRGRGQRPWKFLIPKVATIEENSHFWNNTTYRGHTKITPEMG
jgi:hypothetical protein